MLIPIYETEEEALGALTALKAPQTSRRAAPVRRVILRTRPPLQRVH
jgi:hypothetical protein